MAFSLSVQHEGQVVILGLQGYLDLEAGKQVRARVEDLVGQGARRLVFDLAACPLVSSAALGELIDIVSKTLSMPDLKLCFCAAANTVMACFSSVGLTMYAQVTPDRATAVRQVMN